VSPRPLFSGLGLAATVLMLASGAQARQPSAAESQSLKDAVAKLDTATRANDMGAVVGFMSPRVVAVMAKQSHVSHDVLRKQMIDDAANALKQVKITGVMVDWAHATYPDVSKTLEVVLIPTQTDAQVNGVTVHSRSTTLAILDGGVWSMLAVANPDQMQIVVEAYPELAALKIPDANAGAH
jgi:hypothetical protein